jgi:hypothetical protein
VRRDDQSERAPDTADLLDGDRIGERVESAPALFLGEGNAEPAHLAEAADDVHREATLPFVGLHDRGDLVDHEVADRVAQEAVLRR